jgi:hypothetical protein
VSTEQIEPGTAQDLASTTKQPQYAKHTSLTNRLGVVEDTAGTGFYERAAIWGFEKFC